MEKRKNFNDNVLIWTMIGIIVFSSFAMAYAVSGFQTYNKIDVTGAPSSNECDGITVLPLTNYVIQACDTGTATTTFRVSQYDGTAIATATTVTDTTANGRRQCWSVSDTIGICSLTNTNGLAGLTRITVTSATTVSKTDFTNPAIMGIGGGQWNLSGTNLYGGATNGNFYRVSESSFTQTGVWTGLTTGTPTCTNLRMATSISTGKGIAICDTNTIILFSYDETAGSGAVTKLASGNAIGSWTSSAGTKFIQYDGSSYLYYGYSSNALEAIGLDLTSDTFTTTAIQYTINAQMFRGGTGGYWVIVATNNNMYLLKKLGVTPPNNLVAVQAIPTTIGATAVTFNTHDSSNYVISKGNNGNTTVFYLQALILHNESDNPITSGATDNAGGVDCTDEANENILICRLVEQTGGNIGGVSGIISTGLFNVFTNAGLIDGTDTNPQTNGIGYIILVAGLGVMAGMFYLATGDLRKVPTFIWMISSIAMVGAFTIIGYIDPTFLIISIIVIVALAAMQIRNAVGSGIDFASGGNF